MYSRLFITLLALASTSFAEDAASKDSASSASSSSSVSQGDADYDYPDYGDYKPVTPEPTPCPTPTPEPTPCPTPAPKYKKCKTLPVGDYYICTAQVFGKKPKCLGSKPPLVIPDDSDDCHTEPPQIIDMDKVYALKADTESCDPDAVKFTISLVEGKPCTYTLSCADCANEYHSAEVIYGEKGLVFASEGYPELAELESKTAITVNEPESAFNFKTTSGSYIHIAMVHKFLKYGPKFASADLRLYKDWESVQNNDPVVLKYEKFEV